jgi:hypothetical protein
MKPLRNLQRGFGRPCLLNVALTTTPSVIEKTKEVVIPYPGRQETKGAAFEPPSRPQTRNGVPFVLPGAPVGLAALGTQRTAVSVPRPCQLKVEARA